MDVDRFFDEAGRARVGDAVRRAEAASRGQIVPVVVEKSDPYPEARFRGAILAAVLATAAVLLLDLPLTLAELPLLQAAAGLLGGLISMWDPLERRLVGQKGLDQAVRSRALRAFHEEGLQRTAEGTGVLIFASLFERRAVVLGDHAIHARMGAAGWDGAVQALLAGLRSGDPGQGFEQAVARCGERLAEHFPRQAGQAPPTNELADVIRVSRS